MDIKKEAVDLKAESDDPALASLDFILEDAGGESSEVKDEAGLDMCFDNADSDEAVVDTLCPQAVNKMLVYKTIYLQYDTYADF